jgi:eukaryotic-like serine/threonine-protein kinase
MLALRPETPWHRSRMNHRIRPDSRFPPPRVPLPRRIAERFELVRWLGEGGMGTVYLARDEKFDRMLAVKMLLGGDPGALARFKQEFRALADISHPNLIVLHELFCDAGTWLFTMDYVEGRDFLAHVSAMEARDAPTLLETDAARARPHVSLHPSLLPCPVRDEALLRRVLLQLTDAIQHLHRAGKLHLDLKPSNVLVGPDDHVTVLDFGLARDLHQGGATASDRLLGTPAYMAPEQAEGKRFEPASDWYSVGVMLYEALCGRLPFEGPIAHMLLSKISQDPEPPSRYGMGVPPALERLCMRLLAREPAQRAGGDEILAELGRERAHAGTLRAPSSRDEPFVGRCSVLERLARTARAEGARALLIQGRSGVGKSTLVQRFLDELAGARERLVLRGLCHEREAVPFKAFDGIVDALIAALAKLEPPDLTALLPRHAHTLVRLFPAFALIVPRGASSGEDEDGEVGRTRAYRAFAELFARLSDRYELVLFIDDLHWSDHDSALLLRALFAPPEPVPLLLVGTYRREQAHDNPLLAVLHELASADAALQLDEVELAPLATDEAEALAKALLRRAGASESLASEIAHESHGVPRFIHELARHAREHAGSRTVSLGKLLAQRIAALPSAANALLTVLAVAGGPTAQRVLFRAAELGDGAGAVVHTLRVAGLATSRGVRPEDALEPAHDRVRDVVLERLPREAARQLHGQLLGALALEPVQDDEQLYRHCLGAELHERALMHATRAAQRALRALAAHRSAELYREALALDMQLGSEASRRAALLEGLAEALAASSHCLDAGELFLEAAALDVTRMARLEQRAADQLLRGGDLARGSALLRRVLERCDVSYPESAQAALAALTLERARLFGRGLAFVERPIEDVAPRELETLSALKLALGVYWLVEPVRGALFATLYLRRALDAGQPRHVLRGLETEAAYVSLVGGAKAEARAVELYRAARELTARVGSAGTEGGYRLAEAGFHAIYGRKQKSSECALAALSSTRQAGLSWERAYARFHVYQNTLYIGGRPGLADELAEHVREAESRRDRFASATLLPMLALTCLMGDAPDQAAEALARIRPILSPEVFSFLDMQELIWSALTDAYRGDPISALRRYAAAADRYAVSGVPRLTTWRLLHHWGVLLAHTSALSVGDDPALHLRAAQQRIRAIEREGIAWALPFAAVGRAALHQLAGEIELRDRMLARAHDESAALGYRPFSLLFARSAALYAGDQDAVARCEAELRALGIANPLRWQRTWAPCLAPHAT